MTGVPAIHPGATPIACRQAPKSLLRRGVNVDAVADAPSLGGAIVVPVRLPEPLAGTTVQTIPGTLGHLPARFSQFKCMNQPGKPGVILASFRLTSEGSLVRTQLRPPEKTRSDSMLILISLIPESQREPPVHGPDRGRVPRAAAASSSITRARPTRTAGTTGTAGPWRGVLSEGFGPDGGRRRYKVSGRTKQDVIEALKKKSEELDAGLNTSRSYTVESAAHDWLEYGLPGRSERTRELYRDALAPLLAKIGKRPPSGPHRRGDRGKSEVAHRNPVQPVPADRS